MSTEVVVPSTPGLGQLPDAEHTLREIVNRTRSLYSLPAVALEVIRLTSNLQVDARLLKDCIEKDPALTAKILRVVNSSLFGLSREVSDLNQALALLGTKPLKLLVLGFSLPEGLFAEVARKQLDWYWRTTLIRAVTAREISERLWKRSGDDAFLAGMLQDIGMLVLLNQLREPYAEFLGCVIDERGNLDCLETEFLGFSHTTLSAELLQNWNMPEVLVEAIAEKRDYQTLANLKTPAATLAQILHLSGLLAELVGQNRLQVLPDLLEVGEAYCGFNKERLHEIVPLLQEKVQQLADVLSLDLPPGIDYSQIVGEAHAQMAQIAETVAARLSQPSNEDERAYERLHADANQLRTAVSEFLRPRPVAEKKTPGATPSIAPRELRTQSSRLPHASASESSPPQTFSEKLTWVVGHCRSKRQPLSVMLVELRGSEPNAQEQQLLAQVFETASRVVDVDGKLTEVIAASRWVMILPNCERQQAVRHAHDLLRKMDQALGRFGLREQPRRRVVGAGVASVALAPKNFLPLDLLSAAERCLSATQTSGASAVKSLEIF